MNPVESASSDSSNGLVNGLGEGNEQGNMGVVKKHKKSNQFRSSASSQGSGIRDELTMRDSSSTSSADEGEHQINTEKRRKKNRKHRSAIHRQMDDEDDERTDSADEEEEDYDTRPRTHPPPFPPGSVVTYDPTPSSILKPLSPTMLTVGYGAELMMARPQPNQREYVAQIIDSPNQSEGHGSSTGPLSPVMSSNLVHGMQSVNAEPDNSVLSLVPSSLPPNLSTGATAGSLSNGTAAVLNPSSSISAAAANALPFAGWWGQHTPIYSPFCGPSGSVATTPVATEGTRLLRPGSTVVLPAVICQESEGILIVNVQWRNKSFSGSLIDVNQHQWAPPRLAEGFQEIPIQLKDLYSKQDSEKEPVDVVIDEDKEEEMAEIEQETPHKQEVSDDDIKAPPTSDKTKTSTEKAGPQADVTLSTPSKTSPVLVKPPNGLQVPSIISMTPVNALQSMTDKLKPALPAFDAVKSPQPQIGRDDNEVSTRKRDSTPHGIETKAPVDSSSLTEAHHNLNTLVDVAAKMKHVSNDAPPTHKIESKSKEEHKTFGSYGTVKAPPIPGNDSDSSGSGSISPVRKNQYQLKDSCKEIKSEPAIGGGVMGGAKSSDPSVLNNALPFQLQTVSLQPISPGEDIREDNHQVKKSGSGKQTASGYPWVPPHEHHGEKKPMVVPSIISYNNNSSSLADHAPQPFPPPSVIQDKHRHKRKRQNFNEPSKRPSPPMKDRDSPAHGDKPLSTVPMSLGGKSSLAQRDVGPHMSIMGQEHVRPTDPSVPPGFIYDPSLPMPLNYQLLSFERQKAAEADRNLDRTPPKVIKKTHPSYDHLAPHDTGSHGNSRSPPHPNASTKRSSGGSHAKIAPGVVMQPDSIRIMGMMGQPPPHIKQEGQMPSRPARPSSKGGGVSGHGAPSSAMKNPSGHSSRKQMPSSSTGQSRRSEPVLIKQEPPDHQGGSHPLLQHVHHPHGGLISFPGFSGAGAGYPAVVISSAPNSSGPNLIQTQQHIPTIHTQPTWAGVISGTPFSSQSPHSRTNDLPVSSRILHTRTPSPNPSHKKPTHEWQTHINQQSSSSSANKHDSGGSRQSDKHGISSAHSSSSSSSHSHRSNKHDSSSSRHSQTTPSHPLAPPPIPSLPPPTAAAVQVLSPSHITALRNGLPEEWVKQAQLMEVLQKSNFVSPAQALPTPMHPQELALWQNQMAQMAAMHQLPLDQAAALQMQMQLALQHQQQQQNEAAVTALAAQGFLPLVQPFPVAGAQAVFPFSPLTQAPKTQER